jgi:N-acyl-D-aspartate/D-glutamate deacylase
MNPMRIRAQALIVAVALGLTTFVEAQHYDLVIANGRVVDPESGLDQIRHVGISGRTVAAISVAPLSGRTTINAAGLVVAPGFIDLHAHGQTPETYRFQARDGVTTALELEVGTADIERWYGARTSGTLINHGVSIGHIAVRMAVMRDPGSFLPTGPGAHKAATSAEIKDIARRIEDGLKDGAVSVGAGFPYTPGATERELLEVFRVAGRHRAPVHVHIRRGVAGLAEALKLARQTSAPLHVVHINSAGTTATAEMLTMIGNARAQGLDVTTEAYPYDAGMTEIQSANLDEYQDAPADKVAVLEWPKTGERLNRETFQTYRKLGGPVVLHTNTQEMVSIAVTSPLTMIASDAYWEKGTGHPRTTGTYSRVLGRYVRESRSLTLMDAIRKMTLMPAERLQARVPAMRTKGRLRVGADADITVFDAAQVIDRSTYREPGLAPLGIHHVIVNGVAVVVMGDIVEGIAPGQAVRGIR